jgi:ABC-type transport system involved in multi-copper enzyme maturation permease subunit
MRTLAIARNTFREARRDRAQWVFLLYAVIVVGGGTALTPLAMGEGYRVTRDLGLAAMSLVGMMLIVMVGSGMVQKEIERATVLTVLAKPLRRGEFLIGKYLGLLAMVALVFACMTALLALVLFGREGRIDPAVLWAAGFTFGEFIVLTAVVVAFSTFVSPVLSGVFTVAVFIMGHFSGDLLRFAGKAEGTLLAWTARAAYLALPHMEVFNLRGEAAGGILPAHDVVLASGAYGLLYAISVVLIGSAVFSVREFR